MAPNTAYEMHSAGITELFSDYIEGDANRPFITLSQQIIDPYARNAIEKSLESFGYPPDSCTYATISELDPQALFILIEGLDPLYVIAADAFSTNLLSQAYRLTYPLDSPIRVLGRQSLSFANLSTLIAHNKQKAWRLLKTLST